MGKIISKEDDIDSAVVSDKPAGDFIRGRNYVWRLIKFRPRSEKEIRDRLKLRNYPQRLIEGLVSYFKKTGLIDDKEFARSWINYRLLKPVGIRAIEAELKQKGVSSEV